MPLTQKRLKELLHYDPLTGVFTQLVNYSGTVKDGERAGSDSSGKWRIQIDGQRYVASHLAYLYMVGQLPMSLVDHRDTNQLNDSWDNLRFATSTQNAHNRKRGSNNTSGVKGIHWDKAHQKWYARLKSGGQRVLNKRFEDLELATLVLEEARNLYHGKFANHGDSDSLQHLPPCSP